MSQKEYSRGKAILSFGTKILKYAPVVVATIMMAYCVALEYGFRFSFMDTVFSTSFYGLIVYTSASFAFGFCELHRLFIFYDFLLSFCCDYQTKQGYGFGDLAQPLHWIMFALGIILLLALFPKGIYSNKKYTLL